MKAFNYRLLLLLVAACLQTERGKSQDLKQFTGAWEVWIPGAINYTSRDAQVYRTYTPGAAMNRLTINGDGKYVWGNKQGTLKQVEPWYAQEGRDYYRISDKKGNTYDFWYNTDTDQLVVLFGEVGGHAATGSRWGVTNSKETVAESTTDQLVQHETGHRRDVPKQEVHESSQSKDHGGATGETLYIIGEKVDILWSGGWYHGTVLEINNGKYKVNYEGWGSLYDEWVQADRLRKSSKK